MEIIKKTLVYTLGGFTDVQAFKAPGDHCVRINCCCFEIVLLDLGAVKIKHIYNWLFKMFYMTVEFGIRTLDILTDELATALSKWTSSFVEVIII